MSLEKDVTDKVEDNNNVKAIKDFFSTILSHIFYQPPENSEKEQKKYQENL